MDQFPHDDCPKDKDQPRKDQPGPIDLEAMRPRAPLLVYEVEKLREALKVSEETVATYDLCIRDLRSLVDAQTKVIEEYRQRLQHTESALRLTTDALSAVTKQLDALKSALGTILSFGMKG